MLKNKKAVIFFIIILLLIAGGVFFLWRKENKESIKFEPLKNYLIKETSEGEIVENKNIGLIFKVPRGWDLEKTNSVTWSAGIDEYGIVLSTPDLKPHPNSPWILVPIEGCLINVYVKYDKEESEFIMDEIKVFQKQPTEKQTVIKISDHFALQYIYGNPEELNSNPLAFLYITIEVPIDKRVFLFETYIPSKNSELCAQEFDNFLKTISIGNI